MGNKNNNPLPDERVVYLALKNIFKGPKADFRKAPTVRKLIEQHQEQEGVTDLVNAHTLEVVCQSARKLLSDKVFASTVEAKIRFPERFDPSPTQSAEREASEAEAARHEADAIKHAVLGCWDDAERTGLAINVDNARGEDAVPSTSQGLAQLPSNVKGKRKEKANAVSTPQAPCNVPAIFPIYLPLKTQHDLLVRLQDLLEQVCYDFGKRTMPDMLQDRGWECAESVELNRWANEVFLRRKDTLLFTRHVVKPLGTLFCSIANIRHAAVHRICVNAKGIEQYLLDAEAFALLLGDTTYIDTISRLRRNTQATMEELERNKLFLHLRLDEALRGIAAQRAELDFAEEMAIAEMEREYKEYQMLAGRSLGEAMVPSEESFSTAIDRGNETMTRLDDTDTTNESRDLNDEDQPEDEWETKLANEEEQSKKLPG